MTDPLSITASIIAVLQLATTATKLIKDVKGGAWDRTRLRDELRSTVLLLEMLKDRVEDDEDQWATSMGVFIGPEGPLQQFKVTLELLVSKIASSQSKISHVVQAVKWPFDKDDVNKFLSALERYKSLFSLAMQNDHIKLSQEMHQKLNQISHTLEDMHVGQKRTLNERIISWICPISFHNKQIDVLSKRQPGTGQWLLQSSQFLNWTSTSDAKLWCSGIPGAGKTLLASIIIEHIQQNCQSTGDALAYIYCEYSLQKEQTVINLVSSIIQQLVERLPVLPSSVINLHERHKQQGSCPALTEWTTLLEECLPLFSTISIVVDALDECTEEDNAREKLISVIQQLGPNVRILCTSRPLMSFEGSFGKFTRLEVQANDHDVQLFLRQRIEQEARLRTHTQSKPSLVDLITNTIVAEVKGMFLLAKLHIESLALKQSRKALRAALRTLPKGLDKTYEETLQRIHDQNEDDVLLAQRVLYWLSYAVWPLTVLQLQHAIAAQDVQEEDKSINSDSLSIDDVMIAVCCGLVTIDRESQIVRLVHYTTQDYLERNRNQLFPTASAELAKACLNYLTLNNFSKGPCQTHADLDERLDSMPFLPYAANFWAVHARIAPLEICSEHVFSFINDDNAIQVAIQAGEVSENHSLYGGPQILTSRLYNTNLPKFVYLATVDLPKVLEHVLDERPRLDLEQPDPLGRTALGNASTAGLVTNVQLLLDAGASVDAENSEGESALALAAGNGQLEVLDLLLKHVASTRQQVSDNQDLLEYAVRGNHEACVLKLLQNGADVNAVSSSGESALLTAVEGSQIEICELLLDHGADVNAVSSSGESTLLNAVKERKFEMCELLLQKSADVNAVSSSGESALLTAVEGGEIEICELLLDHGADVNAVSSSGESTLLTAVKERKFEMCELLLQKSADVNAVSSSGESALLTAVEGGEIEICQLLLDHGAVLPQTVRGCYANFHAGQWCNDHVFQQLRIAKEAPGEEVEDGAELEKLQVLADILRDVLRQREQEGQEKQREQGEQEETYVGMNKKA